MVGLAVAPRFAQFDAGDVTGDGAPDLYFVDHDGTETGISEPVSWDLNDRLLVNDGSGYFFDASSGSLTVTQLKSAFGLNARIVDLDADGARDLVKLSYLSNPTGLFAIYNDPGDLGSFQAGGLSSIGKFAEIDGFNVGDLNGDALPDLAISDCASDGFQLGQGYDGLNHLTTGPKILFQYVTGADDGFAQNVVLSDLDLNGWNDVLITDVDADLTGCDRRLHIFHNTGSVPGEQGLVIKEESELASGGTGAGWKGVVGISAVQEKGTYAVAAADFDGDGDPDLLVARCTGTSYFRNQTLSDTCQTDLGFGGPGNVNLAVCGDALTHAGSLATLQLQGAAAGDSIVFALSLTQGALPFKGGTLVPAPLLGVVGPFLADASDGMSASVPGGGGLAVDLFLQAVVKHGSSWQLSNALGVLIGS
ncbi:MAG TPA: VCBS repeat-containing protein [Planctomycetota bacterium]|nr:VCBS repeat-containing protein [Planctomycetota bacterium]